MESTRLPLDCFVEPVIGQSRWLAITVSKMLRLGCLKNQIRATHQSICIVLTLQRLAQQMLA
jgi:hypothetical protein